MKTEDEIIAKLESIRMQIDYWKGMAEEAMRDNDEYLKNQAMSYSKINIAQEGILKWILEFNPLLK